MNTTSNDLKLTDQLERELMQQHMDSRCGDHERTESLFGHLLVITAFLIGAMLLIVTAGA